MRMMVTGGAGFIGSNFVKYMLSKHHHLEIVNLDLLTYSGRLENLKDLEENPHHEFVHGDIRDREKVEELIKKGIDVIVNFAAETHVDRSIVDSEEFILTDVYGSYILLDLARKYEVGRYIQISTDEVYGSAKTSSFNEKASLDPSSPYSASKAAGDLIAQSFYKTYKLPVIITRSSNNFGPYQHPEKLISKLIIRALNNQPLPLYGDGRQVRDWIYVMDNCEAIDLIIRKGGFGEVYNIASGIEIPNLEVADIVLKIIEKPKSLLRFVLDRPGHDRRYSLDTTKIKKLNWKPKYGFDEAIKKTIEWYIKNEWWWKPLLKDNFVRLDVPWS